MEKTCSICKVTKEISNFNKNSYRKNGYRPECKDCRKEKTLLYRNKNKEKINEYNRTYNDRKVNGETTVSVFTIEERRKKVCEYTTKYIKDRSERDPLFKLKVRIRQLFSNSIRRSGYTKKSKTRDILGCEFEEFKTYIESLFRDNMTWKNYGEWHLDHRIPISWTKTEDEIYRLNHYTNLQPLWKDENLSKGNKYIN